MSSAKLLESIIRDLTIISQEDHAHLLFERRHSEWHQRVLSAARARAALDLLTEVEEVPSAKAELWCVPDSGHRTSQL